MTKNAKPDINDTEPLLSQRHIELLNAADEYLESITPEEFYRQLEEMGCEFEDVNTGSHNQTPRLLLPLLDLVI